MLTISNVLLVFLPVATLLAITPGPGMMFALAQGMKSGPIAGIATGLGAATGTFIHTLTAALGVAAFLQAYPLGFELIRWAGIAYLVYLGIKALRSEAPAIRQADLDSRAPLTAYKQSVLVNLLNPKVAIFVLAFVPQFIDPTVGSVFMQFLLLGGLLSIIGGLVDGAIGGVAGRIGSYLNGNAKVSAILTKMSGVIFLSLAAKLAFERR